ncbi:MAG: RidA family protein [Hyphomicrobiales bacterium]|nr:RidA family protein [Hyphomicrobiales bacterium]
MSKSPKSAKAVKAPLKASATAARPARAAAAGKIEKRLAALGVVLPETAPPLANYAPTALSARQLVVSGQLPFGADGKIAPVHIGKLGETVFHEAGRAAARQCAINILAQAQAALGSLDRIKRCVRLGGFINCRSDFNALPAIMNGASDLMVDVFGEAGRHARSTVGVAQLPLDAAVEVEALFELRA